MKRGDLGARRRGGPSGSGSRSVRRLPALESVVSGALPLGPFLRFGKSRTTLRKPPEERPPAHLFRRHLSIPAPSGKSPGGAGQSQGHDRDHGDRRLAAVGDGVSWMGPGHEGGSFGNRGAEKGRRHFSETPPNGPRQISCDSCRRLSRVLQRSEGPGDRSFGPQILQTIRDGVF